MDTTPTASVDVSVKRRPRSTSVSSGSPSPLPGSLPSLLAVSSKHNAIAGPSTWFLPIPPVVTKEKNHEPWGHRASSSVSSIAAPQAISTGGKIARHRRTQSVSPPGFPTLSEASSTGFHDASTAVAPYIGSSSLPLPIPLQHTRRRTVSAKSQHVSMSFSPPRSTLFHFASPPSSTSPIHFASSHAALLSGVRSHQLPNSPTLDSLNYFDVHRSRTGSTTSSPSSPFDRDHQSHTAPVFGSPLANSSFSPPSPRRSSFSDLEQSIGGTFEPNERMPGLFDETPASMPGGLERAALRESATRYFGTDNAAPFAPSSVSPPRQASSHLHPLPSFVELLHPLIPLDLSLVARHPESSSLLQRALAANPAPPSPHRASLSLPVASCPPPAPVPQSGGSTHAAELPVASHLSPAPFTAASPAQTTEPISSDPSPLTTVMVDLDVCSSLQDDTLTETPPPLSSSTSHAETVGPELPSATLPAPVIEGSLASPLSPRLSSSAQFGTPMLVESLDDATEHAKDIPVSVSVSEVQADEGSIPPETGFGFSSGLALMEIDAPNPFANEDDGDEDEDEDDESAVDDETLTYLERIFLGAKSDVPEERARVAYLLADWLDGVDIHEAVEYVLPLLPDLATDDEYLVKEMLAAQLDRIIWYFFSQCAVNEAHELPTSLPVEDWTIRYPVALRHSYDDLVSSPASQSTHTAPTTSKTSPAGTDYRFSDPPSIAVATFTCLLGALLTDQSTVTAKSAQAAFVRFLCRLNNKPLLDYTASPPPVSILLPLVPLPAVVESAHPYSMTAKAIQLIQDEFVCGIVLGLARLEEDEEAAVALNSDGHSKHASVEVDLAPSSADLMASEHDSTPSSPASPFSEEDPMGDDWLNSTVDGSLEDASLRSFFDDDIDRPAEFDSSMPTTFSTAPIKDEEESAIGKAVSMSLIAALGASDCLDPAVIEQHLLPEIEKMQLENMIFVRREAVEALSSVSRTLTMECLVSVVLPLHTLFSRDSLWHVRRAACLAMATICQRLSLSAAREHMLPLVRLFASDETTGVRSSALEMSGPLIHLFHLDPLGVPDELLHLFLDETPATTPATASIEDDSFFSPLPTALDSESFFEGPLSWTPVPTGPNYSAAKDPDRPIHTSFNFPAVALTLGRDKWYQLEELYAELTASTTNKVRRALASSVHEIAGIIGPAQASKTLFQPFCSFLHDVEVIQSAALEYYSTIVLAFTRPDTVRALDLTRDIWSTIRNWRMREHIAKQLVHVGRRMAQDGGMAEVLYLLEKALKDSVASVRDAAVSSIGEMYTYTTGSSRDTFWMFLSEFSEDVGFRNRLTWTCCASAMLKAGISALDFEEHLSDVLMRLAEDRVAGVRIGVGRVVGTACSSGELYSDPTSRDSLRPLLAKLAKSADRDVQLLISLLVPQPSIQQLTPAAPSRTANRLSALLAEEDEDESPVAKPCMAERRQSLMVFDESPVRSQTTAFGEEDATGEDEDMDLVDDDEIYLVQAPLFSPAVVVDAQVDPITWTSNDMDGEEAGFLEVSQQSIPPLE